MKEGVSVRTWSVGQMGLADIHEAALNVSSCLGCIFHLPICRTMVH
jgi:hypothetical protein